MNLKSQLHNNSPTILAGLGVLGFLGAIVMTAKAAPKAERKLKHLPQNATLKDKVKVVTPVYAPVAGMALISTACIVGSNRIHNYRYGALLALYSIGQQSLERWQDSALEVVGQKKFEKIVDGLRLKHIMGCWFTNLDTTKRHEKLILYKRYTPKEYPKYDNYDAINVNKVSEIPCDYNGVMGVPITFLDKYNPDQFDIIKFRKGDDEKDLIINGKSPYFRILVKRKNI